MSRETLWRLVKKIAMPNASFPMPQGSFACFTFYFSSSKFTKKNLQLVTVDDIRGLMKGNEAKAVNARPAVKAGDR